MKLIVPTLLLMTMLSYAQAMDSNDDSYDLNDIKHSPIPVTDLTEATITRSKEGTITIVEAVLAAGNQIIIQQHTSAQTPYKYIGEHLFTSQKGSEHSVDLSPTHAQDLFDQCVVLLVRQEAKKSSPPSSKK